MNSLKISGNSGKDPTDRTTQSGKLMATFSIAHSYGKDENKRTMWFEVVAFDELAAEVMDRVKKGTKVLVEGRFQIEEWTRRDNTPAISYKLFANNIVFDPPAETRLAEGGSNARAARPQVGRSARPARQESPVHTADLDEENFF